MKISFKYQGKLYTPPIYNSSDTMDKVIKDIIPNYTNQFIARIGGFILSECNNEQIINKIIEQINKLNYNPNCIALVKDNMFNSNKIEIFGGMDEPIQDKYIKYFGDLPELSLMPIENMLLL